MFFEAQIKKEIFCTLADIGFVLSSGFDVRTPFFFEGEIAVVNRIVRRPSGIDLVAVPVGLGHPNAAVVGAGFLSNPTVARLVVPFDVQIVKLSDLDANDTAPSPVATFEATAQIDIIFARNNQGLVFYFDLVELDLSEVLEEIFGFAEIRKATFDAINSHAFFTQASVDNLLSDPLFDRLIGENALSDAAATLDSTGSFVGVLLEFGGPSPNSFQRFDAHLQRQIPDLLQGRGFAVLAPVTPLRDTLRGQLIAELHAGFPEFDVVQPAVEVLWDPGSTKFDIKVNGAIKDACLSILFWQGKIDVGFEVPMEITIRMPEPNKLVIRLFGDVDIDDTDVLECQLALAIPFVGFIAGLMALDMSASGKDKGVDFFPAILGVISGPIVRSTSFLIGAGIFPGQAISDNLTDRLADFTEVENSAHDLEFVSSSPIDIQLAPGQLIDGDLQIDEVFGVGNGLVLRGNIPDFNRPKTSGLQPASLDTQPSPRHAQLAIAESGPRVTWGWASKCDPGPYRARFRLLLSNAALPGWAQPLEVFEAKPVNDPLGQFAGRIRATPGNGNVLVSMEIPYADVLPAFRTQPPYPLQLLIRTNAGVRLITEPFVPPPSAEVQLQEGLRAGLVNAECRKWEEVRVGLEFPLFDEIERVTWHAETVQVWALAAEVEADEAVVQAVTRRGEPLVEARVPAGDEAAPMVFEAPVGERIVVRSRAGDARVAAEQFALGRRGGGAAPKDARAALFGIVDNRPTVLLRSADGVHLGSVDPTGAARTWRFEAIAPEDGVVAWRNGYVVFGAGGATLREPGAGQRLFGEPVRAACGAPGALILLTGAELARISGAGEAVRPIARIDRDDATEPAVLVRAGSDLVLGIGRRLRRYARSGAEAWDIVGEIDLDRPMAALHAAPFGFPTTTVVVTFADGEAAFWSARTDGALRPWGSALPWFVTAPRRARTFVRYVADAGRVEVWDLVKAQSGALRQVGLSEAGAPVWR